jgi:hypothetical protein
MNIFPRFVYAQQNFCISQPSAHALRVSGLSSDLQALILVLPYNSFLIVITRNALLVNILSLDPYNNINTYYFIKSFYFASSTYMKI